LKESKEKEEKLKRIIEENTETIDRINNECKSMSEKN